MPEMFLTFISSLACDLLVEIRGRRNARRIESLPRSAATKIISRIKVLSGLDIAEKNSTGRLLAFQADKAVLEMRPSNMRVSKLPVIHGGCYQNASPHDEPISLEHTGMTRKRRP